MSGMVKNLELAKAKQYICLYITGIIIFWLVYIKKVFPTYNSLIIQSTFLLNKFAVGIPLKNNGMRHLHWCWVELPGSYDPFSHFLEV